MLTQIFIVCGAGLAFLAVVIGAFGAHGLEGKLSDKMLAIYQTGVQYHMYHALGLLFVGMYIQVIGPSALMTWAGGLLIAGIVIFSGSLYVLSITGITWLGAITPIGGLAFLTGWILIAIAALRG